MVLEIFYALLDSIFLVFQTLEENINTSAPMGILLLGVITGLRHAIEADHIAAVSMLIASDEKKKLRRAPILGALWGLGHTASLFAAGLIVLILAINIPEKVSNTLEFGVGVMLVYLAITTLTGFNIGKFVKGLLHHDKIHSHPHSHKKYDIIHTHEHNHYHYEKEHQHGHKALLVGMIHGLAGSGALMLIVLSTIDSIPFGLAYITIFGAGSILGMMALSTIVGLPFAKAKRSAKLNFVLKYVAGVTTLMIGGWLMYELGVVEQIFL